MNCLPLIFQPSEGTTVGHSEFSQPSEGITWSQYNNFNLPLNFQPSEGTTVGHSENSQPIEGTTRCHPVNCGLLRAQSNERA